MLGYINSTGGVECEALAIADPSGEALGRREVLPGPVRVVAPGAGARFELRTGSDPRRVERPVLDLAGIGGGAEIDKEIALPVDRKRVHRVIAGEGQPRNNDLGRRGWGKCSSRWRVAHDAIVHFRVERAVVENDACATVAAVHGSVTEARDDVGAPFPLGVLKGEQKPACRRLVVAVIEAAPGVDINNAIRGKDELRGMANSVREDGCAKA